MPESITVLLCYSPAPRQVLRQEVRLPAPCSAQNLLQQQADLLGRWGLRPDGPDTPKLGLWNARLPDPAAYTLQDGDRLELYRPLRVDPMTARRERFQSQGARSAGLFAQRRPGAKSGY